MIQVTVKLVNDISPYCERVKAELAKYPDRALTEMRRLTPIRSGNARRRTTLENQMIQADYAYAQRLDQGWSRQAPRGMTEPLQRWAQREARRIFRRT